MVGHGSNVVAIIGTGIVVMSFYGVNKLSRTDVEGRAQSLRRPVVFLSFMVVIIGVPLALTSIGVAARAIVEGQVHSVADGWASDADWAITTVTTRGEEVLIRAEGPLPMPDTASLKEGLAAAGMDTDNVTVELVPVYVVGLD